MVVGSPVQKGEEGPWKQQRALSLEPDQEVLDFSTFSPLILTWSESPEFLRT